MVFPLADPHSNTKSALVLFEEIGCLTTKIFDIAELYLCQDSSWNTAEHPRDLDSLRTEDSERDPRVGGYLRLLANAETRLICQYE